MAVTIYALECRTNGKVYIGSTKGKLGKRMREHRCLLNAGQHKAATLQEDWRQYGEAEFRIVSLEIGDYDLQQRRAAEVRWMQHHRAYNQLYNEHLISMRPTDEAIRKGVATAHRERGNRWTPEANMARRLMQLGKPKGHGAKISATKRALGQKPSAEIARRGGLAAAAKRYGK